MARTVFSGDADPAVLSRATQRGRLVRLARGVYSGLVDEDPAVVVGRNLWPIIAHEFPGAVIADRSVPEGGRARDGALFVIHRRTRPVALPGIVVYPRPGCGPVDGDMELPHGLHIASIERALLENLASSRARPRRTLERAKFERWLERLLQQRGEDGVNASRDRARRIADGVGRSREMTLLDDFISAAMRTHDGIEAVTPAFAGRLAGEPFDAERVARFADLAAYLDDTAPESLPALAEDAGRRHILPFYEAYFSNFIEGTEFTLDEAAEIVFDNLIPAQRPQDAPDIIGTYRIVADKEEMRRTPRDAGELELLLKARHAVLLDSRPDKTPGQFKTRNNRAGGTLFLNWDLVPGTLHKGFDAGRHLRSPFDGAVFLLFLLFLIAEVHPFADGNGRIARIMMNAELATAGEVKIIVPTVYRNNYLSALRGATHNSSFSALRAMLAFAWRWTARVNFTDRTQAEADLMRTNATRDSNEADQSGVRLELPR
ncbi:MAG: Fic family protein [Acidimicrobiales bacterium]